MFMGAAAYEHPLSCAARLPRTPIRIASRASARAKRAAASCCPAACGLGSDEGGLTVAQKYDERITVAITSQMAEYLRRIAGRQRTSVGDIVRQAVREYLDRQEDVIGSRSRVGSRIARQLEQMPTRFLQQHLHTSTLLLAAVILLQMKQGAQGSDVLAQIAQLASHAGAEIQAILEAKE